MDDVESLLSVWLDLYAEATANRFDSPMWLGSGISEALQLSACIEQLISSKLRKGLRSRLEVILSTFKDLVPGAGPSSLDALADARRLLLHAWLSVPQLPARQLAALQHAASQMDSSEAVPQEGGNRSGGTRGAALARAAHSVNDHGRWSRHISAQLHRRRSAEHALRGLCGALQGAAGRHQLPAGRSHDSTASSGGGADALAGGAMRGEAPAACPREEAIKGHKRKGGPEPWREEACQVAPPGAQIMPGKCSGGATVNGPAQGARGQMARCVPREASACPQMAGAVLATAPPHTAPSLAPRSQKDDAPAQHNAPSQRDDAPAQRDDAFAPHNDPAQRDDTSAADAPEDGRPRYAAKRAAMVTRARTSPPGHGATRPVGEACHVCSWHFWTSAGTCYRLGAASLICGRAWDAGQADPDDSRVGVLVERRFDILECALRDEFGAAELVTPGGRRTTNVDSTARADASIGCAQGGAAEASIEVALAEIWALCIALLTPRAQDEADTTPPVALEGSRLHGGDEPLRPGHVQRAGGGERQDSRRDGAGPAAAVTDRGTHGQQGEDERNTGPVGALREGSGNGCAHLDGGCGRGSGPLTSGIDPVTAAATRRLLRCAHADRHVWWALHPALLSAVASQSPEAREAYVHALLSSIDWQGLRRWLLLAPAEIHTSSNRVDAWCQPAGGFAQRFSYLADLASSTKPPAVPDASARTMADGVHGQLPFPGHLPHSMLSSTVPQRTCVRLEHLLHDSAGRPLPGSHKVAPSLQRACLDAFRRFAIQQLGSTWSRVLVDTFLTYAEEDSKLHKHGLCGNFLAAKIVQDHAMQQY
eukprot:jgi/Mesvir1/28077/Mv25022-RA.1